jgi:hypothetical protein
MFDEYSKPCLATRSSELAESCQAGARQPTGRPPASGVRRLEALDEDRLLLLRLQVGDALVLVAVTADLVPGAAMARTVSG